MSEMIGRVEVEFYRNGQMRITTSGDRFGDVTNTVLTDSGAAIADVQSTPENYTNFWWEVSPSPGYARHDPAPLGFFVGYGADLGKVFTSITEQTGGGNS